MKKANQPLGVVLVIGEDKESMHKEFVFDDRKHIWGTLLECWPTIEDKGVTFVLMPLKAAKFQKSKPMTCLYSAIDSYMSSLLGRKLDVSDADFFDEHPLTGSLGVSQPNTLRVAHELTGPYGVCVSRVRLWPGTTIAGDLKQWIGVLGMNPLAMLDRQTSNKMFCDKTGLSIADAERQFRFEFSEEPLRPAISCGTYNENKIVVGHASYESPRAPYLSHIMQFQLAHRDEVNWEKEPVLAAIENPNSDRCLSLYQCLDPEGKPMYTRMNSHSSRGSLPQTNQNSGTTLMVHQPRSGFSTPVKRQIRTCFLCYSETGDRIGANLCIRCWSIFLKDVACGECGHWLATAQYTSAMAGLYRRGIDWYMSVRCSSCQEKNDLLCLPGTVSNAIQKAMRGEDDGVVTHGHNSTA